MESTSDGPVKPFRPWGPREWVENLAWDLLFAGAGACAVGWLTWWLTPWRVPTSTWVAAAVVGAVSDTLLRWRRLRRAAASPG